MAKQQTTSNPALPTILLVDDEESIRRQMAMVLEDDYRVLQASARKEALALVDREQIDVVVCDLHMPPSEDDITEGLAVLEGVRQRRPLLPVIVVSGDEDLSTKREVVQRSSYAPLPKPFRVDELLILVRNAAQSHSLHTEVEELRQELRRLREADGSIVGSSPALQRIKDQARTVAETSATVLITGESGTGKEVLARYIHEVSARASRPFIACNIAALPETLVESELFGHEKGAFTGATSRREGRFELANGGTLFLDEIGELTPTMQVKLLRVLQERQFERLGGKELLSVDIRIIAATNRNLEQMVDQGQFRADLYYRLNIVNLELPPLRGRQEDIPILAAHFARKAALKHGKGEPGLTEPFVEKLTQYRWPGNIRELENVIERAVVISPSPYLDLSSLPEKIAQQAAPPPPPVRSVLPQLELIHGALPPDLSFESAITDFKRELVRLALRECHDSRSEAAQRLGISRQYLHRLINELKVLEKPGEVASEGGTGSR
ncbi:MAG: sigma-54-dependent transcriptional regulator [Blastocatellia bacterium]|jgi:DNA-binding NtrC family response regulator